MTVPKRIYRTIYLLASLLNAIGFGGTIICNLIYALTESKFLHVAAWSLLGTWAIGVCLFPVALVFEKGTVGLRARVLGARLLIWAMAVAGFFYILQHMSSPSQ